MISVLQPDSTKCGSMVTDWPDLNPRPILDPDRSWLHAYQPDTVASQAVPQVGLLPGYMPSVYFGERIPDALVSAIPRKVRLRVTPGKKWLVGRLKDFNKLTRVPVISKRAVELIESLASGRNQFFPVDFLRVDNDTQLFEAETYYLLNVCDTVRADRLFPFEAFERNLNAGRFDYLDEGTFADAYKTRRLQYRKERPLPSGRMQVTRDAVTLRFELHGMKNRFLVDPDAAQSTPIFVVANHCDRSDGGMNLYGAAYGELFVTDAFRAAVKKAKLTGTIYEPCVSLDIVSGATARKGGRG